jgi:hypothetical protein
MFTANINEVRLQNVFNSAADALQKTFHTKVSSQSPTYIAFLDRMDLKIVNGKVVFSLESVFLNKEILDTNTRVFNGMWKRHSENQTNVSNADAERAIEAEMKKVGDKYFQELKSFVSYSFDYSGSSGTHFGYEFDITDLNPELMTKISYLLGVKRLVPRQTERLTVAF